jgi:hypothetical protein
MTPIASRSLTEPIGLKASSLAKTFTCRGASAPMRTTGVLPIVSRMLSNFVPIAFDPSATHSATVSCPHSSRA